MTDNNNTLLTIRNLIAAATLSVVIGACGGNDAPQAARENAAAPGTPAQAASEPSGDTASGSVVRSMVFNAEGIEPASSLPDASELTVSGGCVGSSPLSIGVRRGAPSENDYFAFSINSASPVAPGQLGDVELTKITWDNGVTTPANLPADSPVRVPVRYEGAGVLKLQSHTGTGLAGRMSGVVTGDVSNKAGDEVASLVVEFDINLACAR